MHHIILQSSVKAVIIATTNWAAILWVLWSLADDFYKTFPASLGSTKEFSLHAILQLHTESWYSISRCNITQGSERVPTPLCNFLEIYLSWTSYNNFFPLSCLGRKTFPASRGSTARRPQLSPSMMRRDPGDSGSTHSSRTGSNASLSKKSDTSSGIVSDDPPSLRSRRDSELETAINALHELNIRENAKCKLNEDYFSCRVEKECMGGGFTQQVSSLFIH